MFKPNCQAEIDTVDFYFSTVLDYIFVIKAILVENVREVLFVAYRETFFPTKNEIFHNFYRSYCGRTLYLDEFERVSRCFQGSRVSKFSLEIIWLKRLISLEV